MRISATGRRTPDARNSIRGFTLIEILVVVLIIGVMAAGVVLSLGRPDDDRELDQERDRILTITGYLHDQAGLQNREYGMRCFDGGYEFLVLDVHTARWMRLQDDPLVRPRRLPAGVIFELVVEGRPALLPKADTDTDTDADAEDAEDAEEAEDLAPQILLFSSGELSSFELTLRRQGGKQVKLLPDNATGEITVQETAATTS